MTTERITSERAVAWALAHGAVAHVVDGSDLTTKADVITAIGEALEFPSWHGRNLDALFDGLTDLSWLPDGPHVLVWSHHQVLAAHDWQAYQQVKAALTGGAAAGAARRLTVLLTTT